MTNVPTVTFGPNGFIAPAQADVLAGVQADINAAFGGGLDQSLTTPQGQLATSITAIIGQVNDTFIDITNQMNPAFADGRWQDAIADIYFLQRNPSEPTVVPGFCTGGAGVVIPAGSLAQSEDGNIYTCTDGGTIPVGGSITLTFACNTIGPIPCPAGTLNKIYRNIPGWDTIVNLADGVLGNNTETRSEFEARRAASVALNSIGSLPSVLAAVLNVPGVLDAYVTENSSGSPVTVGGVTLVANSLYVAAVGGVAADVGRAIWSKKAPGCNYNGNTTVTVIDDRSGYSPPFPTYDVKFETPPALPILFAISIANNALVPADAATQIENAIIAAFAGVDGGARARIGSTVYASRYYAPIAALGSWAQIILIQVGSQNTPGATFTGVIAGTALTTSGATGTIAIGQTLSDSTGTLVPGTKIISGSGTSWQVNFSQTVSSETMKGSVAASNSVTVDIDQAPTINAANIAVTLV